MTDEAANELAKLLVKLTSSGNIKEVADTLRNASSSEKRVSAGAAEYPASTGPKFQNYNPQSLFMYSECSICIGSY